jgi:hypothetical protein
MQAAVVAQAMEQLALASFCSQTAAAAAPLMVMPEEPAVLIQVAAAPQARSPEHQEQVVPEEAGE